MWASEAVVCSMQVYELLSAIISVSYNFINVYHLALRKFATPFLSSLWSSL